jgi:NADH-quinone oxidoreductase subunit N
MLILNSVIGLYYYIKLIAAMFERQTEEQKRSIEQLHPYFYIVSGVTMAMLTVTLLWIGVFPNGMIAFIRAMMTQM